MCYSNKIDTNAAVGAHFVQCVSGRAILMQTTKTRMWGKGTLTKSWKRWVNIIVKINNAFCGLVCVCKFICKEWDIYIYFFQKIKVSSPPPPLHRWMSRRHSRIQLLCGTIYCAPCNFKYLFVLGCLMFKRIWFPLGLVSSISLSILCSQRT